jgi:hypothetical protein
VTAVAQRPVQQIAARISSEPVRAGLVGLLGEILFVPVLVVTILALVISIIGIPLLLLVPFGIILVGIVMLVGFTGAAHLVGTWTLERFGRAERNPYLVAAVGIVVIAGLTLIGRLFALAIGGLVRRSISPVPDGVRRVDHRFRRRDSNVASHAAPSRTPVMTTPPATA